MTVLPIVERELRVAARRRATYWNRTGSAAVAIALFTLMFVVGATEPSRELGQYLFRALSACFLVASLLAGVVYTADCLSEERREGTLGLLFLTDLKGYDVVLGKVAASSLGAVYAILAILPVLAIPLLMGGVSVGEFGRVVLVLVNTLFFSLAAGVLISAWLRQGLASMALTLAVVMAINLLPPLVGVGIALATNQAPPEPWLIPSVGYACAVAHEPLYGGRQHAFLISLSVTQGLGWLFLVLASLQVRHAWQEGAGTVGAAAAERLANWLRGDPAVQRRWQAEALEANPCYWLGGRLAYKAWIVWAALGVVAVLWLAAWARWGQDWANEGVALLTVLGLHTLLRGWLAGEATLGLGPDRRSGALELILCTELSVRDIVGGRVLALQRQFRGPTVFVLFVDLVLLIRVLGETGGGEEALWWLAIFLVLMLVFVLDMVALAWLGLWWGLVCRQATRAVLRSLALIFALPWILLVTGLTFAIVLHVAFPEPEWLTVPAAYAGVCGAVSVWGGQWARERLLTQLRATVAGTMPRAGNGTAVSLAAGEAYGGGPELNAVDDTAAHSRT
jgi:ABC-type transport system involved in multi-copper enzyme maturation permease subunit